MNHCLDKKWTRLLLEVERYCGYEHVCWPFDTSGIVMWTCWTRDMRLQIVLSPCICLSVVCTNADRVCLHSRVTLAWSSMGYYSDMHVWNSVSEDVISITLPLPFMHRRSVAQYTFSTDVCDSICIMDKHCKTFVYRRIKKTPKKHLCTVESGKTQKRQNARHSGIHSFWRNLPNFILHSKVDWWWGATNRSLPSHIVCITAHI